VRSKLIALQYSKMLHSIVYKRAVFLNVPSVVAVNTKKSSFSHAAIRKSSAAAITVLLKFKIDFIINNLDFVEG
jgi:hypothetical protein